MTEFALGIPYSKKIHNIPKTTKRQDWKVSIQKHVTRRGKTRQKRTHYDLRLSPKDSVKAYSWAIPKNLPKPGERVLAVEQPTHTRDYMAFRGALKKGYGEGRVDRVLLDNAEVLRSSNNKVVFNLYDKKIPQEYALVRIGKRNWILLNRTKTKDKVPPEVLIKPKYKDFSISKIDFRKAHKDVMLMPKLDGAFSSVIIDDKGALRAFSYRKPKSRDTGLIEYTHKIEKLLDTRKLKDLKNTVIRAEILAKKKGIPAEANEIAGMLNAKVRKSRENQRRLGRLEAHAFDIVRYRGKDVSELSFVSRRNLLEKIVSKIKGLKIVQLAKTEAEKSSLLKKILARKYRLTREGVILVDPKQKRFIRAKIAPDYDIFIKEIIEGRGKHKGRAGAIRYSWSRTGPIVGNVGTGMDDALREDMWKNKNKYLNRVARVKALGIYSKNGKRGALRSPSFKEMHTEKNI